MIVNGKHFRAVWREGTAVKVINQLVLPYEFRIVQLRGFSDSADAISTMLVRGAGTIGATAAYGMMLAAIGSDAKEIASFRNSLRNAADVLEATRPTAIDLRNAVERIVDKAAKAKDVKSARDICLKEADAIADEIAEGAKRIGILGEKLIKDNSRILTHCNAGWLALVDYGSALAPVYEAKRKGKKIFVYADETRPRLQGAKLTAWELAQENIQHAIIADNAAGHYMQKGMIDICFVGADRIAMNGDAANKIGTYEKAVLARENGIPFYVAAPLSTFDKGCESGKEIPIEERRQDEVNYAIGLDNKGKLSRVRISNETSSAGNPAFDVTPAKYITGIITPKGIVKPKKSEIAGLWR